MVVLGSALFITLSAIAEESHKTENSKRFPMSLMTCLWIYIFSSATSIQFFVDHLYKSFELAPGIPSHFVITSPLEFNKKVRGKAPFLLYFSASSHYSLKNILNTKINGINLYQITLNIILCVSHMLML